MPCIWEIRILPQGRSPKRIHHDEPALGTERRREARSNALSAPVDVNALNEFASANYTVGPAVLITRNKNDMGVQFFPWPPNSKSANAAIIYSQTADG